MKLNVCTEFILVGCLLQISYSKCNGQQKADEDFETNDIMDGGGEWNELIFTQLWGYSSCVQFKDQTGGQGTCRYEDKPSIWSIHGIWPTEVGTKGPSFCSKVAFNKTAILPILDQLNIYWYEIDAKKEGPHFWSHEWTKHGSCAKELEALSTEFKYFQTALEFRNEYDLYSILKAGGIIPQARRGYALSEISSVIQKATGAKPYIQCLVTRESGVPVDHLMAVEICLDRTFKPVDCSTKSIHHLERDSVGPCPDEHLIQYTDKFTSWKSKTKHEL